MTDSETIAERLNAHLADDGVVQVTTYQKSWLYEKKHEGWFSMNQKGELFVRQGRGKVCLGKGGSMVSIQTGRFVEKSGK